MRRAARAAAGLVVAIGAWPGCSSEAPRDLCVPGATQTCSGPDACAGVQECTGAGTGYGPCQCDEAGGSQPPQPDDDAARRAALDELRAATPRGEPAMGRVGGRCASANDCEGGLACLPSALDLHAEGSPQGGFCTAVCSRDDDCERFDPIAGCLLEATGVDGTPRRLCTPRCLTRTPQPGQLKCAGRSDLACFSDGPNDAPQIGRCVPTCHADAQCGSGRYCDLASGWCREGAPSPGAALGAACADDADCSGGACLSFVGQPPFCSGLCTLGSVAGCGSTADSATRLAACLDPLVATDGVGDLGICSPLCDVDADCARDDSRCRALPAGVDDLLGRRGLCVSS